MATYPADEDVSGKERFAITTAESVPRGRQVWLAWHWRPALGVISAGWHLIAAYDHAPHITEVLLSAAKTHDSPRKEGVT